MSATTLPTGRSDAAASASNLDFGEHGAALHWGAALSCLADLDALAVSQPDDQAGIRLHGVPALAGLLQNGAIFDAARSYLGSAARPVRAILFDKTPQTNWSLGWHQDRTIAVRERRDVCGFGPWTRKQGMLHVAPPFSIIAGMITLRVHLDDVPDDNAPLLIAPGSHRLGSIPEVLIEETVARCGSIACLAQRGDIWVYSTPILHASTAATGARHRRVLQLDYAVDPLPGGLEWFGL